MAATQSVTLTTAAPGPVNLKGGRYMLSCVATFSSSTVALQGLLPDGTTYAAVPQVSGTAQSFSAAGIQVVDLAPSQYKMITSGATAVILVVCNIPID